MLSFNGCSWKSFRVSFEHQWISMIVSYCLVLPFLVIYDIDANSQNFPGSFALSIANGTKPQYNLPFVGHYTNGNKSTNYYFYIKPNNYYRLKVNVTKNIPLKLLQEILLEISFPSSLIYLFCCYYKTKYH